MNGLAKVFGISSIAFLVVAAPVRADSVLINFDFDTDNVPLPHGVIIDSTYASLGVFFEPTVPGGCSDNVYTSSNCLTKGTTSEPNVVTLCSEGGCSDISENAHGLVRAHFASSASQVCIDFIPAHQDDIGVIRAYDSQHALLGETLSTAGVTGPVCVTASGIYTVEFSGYTDSFGWFDNLAIDFDFVPTLPSTFGSIKAMYR